MIVDKVVRTKFIKSEENKADPFTKNVSEKIFLRFYDYLHYIKEKDSNESIHGYNINIVFHKSNSTINISNNSPLEMELLNRNNNRLN